MYVQKKCDIVTYSNHEYEQLANNWTLDNVDFEYVSVVQIFDICPNDFAICIIFVITDIVSMKNICGVNNLNLL